MKLPIPVNIITGSLGVGKTTAVTHLLSQKPPSEKWALLVNEFGALGIDAALVEAGVASQAASAGSSDGIATSPSPSSAGVVVRELAGGCLCCTLSGPLGVAIAQLVRQAKPDRLIIEPSGLGHPAGLLDTLYGEHLRSALDVRAVICLVDVRVAAADGTTDGTSVPNETFQDQINVADVLVGNKADLSSPSQLDAFWRWAEQLYPPKAQVLLATQGRIDLPLLDLPRAPVFRPLFNPQSHTSRRRATQRTTRGAPGAAAAPSPALAAALTDDDASGGFAEDRAPADAPIQLQPGRPLRFTSAPASASGPPQQAAQLPKQPPEPRTGTAVGTEARDADQRGPRVPSAAQPRQTDGAHEPVPGLGRDLALEESDPDLDQNLERNLDRQQASCGWLFSSEDVFDRARLAAALSELWPAAARLKGIFRVGKSSYVVPYLQPDGRVELRAVSYRRESRLEIIIRPSAARKDAERSAGLGGGSSASSPSAPDGAAAAAAAAAAPAAAPAAAAVMTAAAADAETGSTAVAGPSDAADAPRQSRLTAALAAADWEAVERALMGTLRR